MLDECKGDKLEEVLVSFSTVVLRKALAAEKHGDSSITKRLVLTRKLVLKDQESLLPLAVAHRASLTALLRRKKQLRASYSDFQHLLDQKEQDLARRTEHLEAIEESGAARAVPNHVTQSIKRQFDIHWQGDPRWVDILVKGGEHNVRDSLLETDFSEHWQSLNQGTVGMAIPTNQQGVLHDLEKRIVSQQARLQHWQAVKDDLIRQSKPNLSVKNQCSQLGKPRGLELDLSRHKNVLFEPKIVNLEGKEQGMADKSRAASMMDDYARLVDSMQGELTNVGKDVRQSFKSTKGKRNSIFPVSLRDGDKISNSDDFDISAENRARSSDIPSAKTSWTSYGPTLRHENGGDAETPYSPIRDHSPQSHESIETTNTRAQDAATVNSSIESDLRNASKTQVDSSKPELLDENELLAQQIILSTRNAAPSPAKPKHSLRERTRQSMGMSTLAAFEEIPILDPPSMPPPPPTIDSSPPLPSKSTTLLERTRQSMSLMPSTSLQSRKSLRKPRPSKIYPTNQFETPSKQQFTTNTVEEGTPPEKLFAQEADYASVFKSRPKIGLSPTVSPELREVNEMDEFDKSFAVDNILDYGSGSPSMRRTGRVGRF